MGWKMQRVCKRGELGANRKRLAGSEELLDEEGCQEKVGRQKWGGSPGTGDHRHRVKRS